MREVVFQLNPEHEYIANNFTYDDNDIKQIDYISFDEQLMNLETLRVNSCVAIDELKLMIKSFTGKVAKYVADFDKNHDGKLYDNVSSNMTFGMLRQMISNDISDGSINAHNIELFRDEINLCPWNDGIDGDTELEFTLVPYNVTVNYSTQNVYNVKIFLPEQCPLPFFEPNNVKTNVMIIYNKTFLVEDFIDYIFDVVIQKTLYKKQLKHICDIYKQNKDDLNLIFAKHHESKGYCHIMKEYKDEQKINDDYECPKQVEIDLYLLMRPNTYKNMKLITIRFIKCGLGKSQFVRNKKFNDLKDSFFIGLPLDIWLDKNNDSNCLKDVIKNNKYFNKYKDYIDTQTVFKIGDNDEIVSFSMENDVSPNDMILFGSFDPSISETVTSRWYAQV
eukprot:110430_1